MSRLDGKLTAAGVAPLDAADLAALETELVRGRREWRDALACYLSGGEGWRDASALLGGAFSSERIEPERSSNEEHVNQRISEYLQRGALKSDRIGND